MLFVLLRQSFTKQMKAMSLMFISVVMGTAVSASLVAISLDIQGKVSHELRSFGANIIIEPRIEGLADIAGQARFLKESDIPKAKTIFWRHNILGISPFLELDLEVSSEASSITVPVLGAWFDRTIKIPGEGEPFNVGVSSVMPWWEIRGDEPKEHGAMVGVSLAEELGLNIGDSLGIKGEEFKVSGILSTGGSEDNKVILELDQMQELTQRDGAISSVMVSALTTPMDDFAYKDPDSMSTVEYEKWYCTGYVTSISKQLEEVFGGSRAKPIWRVAETEGRVLERLTVLVYLLTLAALVAAALGMSTTLAASVLKRLDEIALMKALGADRLGISIIFLSETMIVGLAGGLAGYLLSLVTAHYIGLQVFGVALTQKGVLFPVSIISALVISSLGAWLPIRRALKVKPAVTLKEAR
jgi:putative ABC transport system permease protein